MNPVTPAHIRAMHARGISRRDISDILGPRCQSRISACLRERTAQTYLGPGGVVRYVASGHRVP